MDIQNYKFYEPENKAIYKGDYVELTYPDYMEHDGNCYSLINIYKQDAIALAKHFKLTADDLL
jgi:hypothetical protein